jgi:hypothetical protein
VNELANVLAHTAPEVEEFVSILDAVEDFLVGRSFADCEVEKAPVAQAWIGELETM